MDCWHREIEQSRTEAEVVGSAADFLALWSPQELAPVTMGWRPVNIRNADDVERVKRWLTEDFRCEVSTEPMRELGDYFWHASARIREIRAN